MARAVSNKERAEKLRIIIDAYGIAVRGGVITPNLDDENAFRKMMGLQPASKEVVAEWRRTKGVRSPITLQRGISDTAKEKEEQGNEQN